jgi:Aldehyde dehydrogenase family
MPGPETFYVYQFKVVLRGISPTIWRRSRRSTPSVAVRLAELAIEAGVPPGIWNIVHGGKDVTAVRLSGTHGLDWKLAPMNGSDPLSVVLIAILGSARKMKSPFNRAC